MALNPLYVTDGPIQEYLVDKDTGLPLAGGTITFYRDSSRITPKTVYQLTGSPPNYNYVALPNPLSLSSVGTPQDAGGDDIVIYYYPWLADGVTEDLYYLVVEDSNGVSQLTREAWPNGVVSGGSEVVDSLPVQNQISNPQFTQILINNVPTLSPPTTTFTVSGSEVEFEVAPNWNLFVNGNDTVTVQRVAIAGSVGAPTNPPYALNVTVGPNISECSLTQRFESNSGLWTSTSSNPVFLSVGLVVKNLIASNVQLSVWYQASNGNQATVPLQLMTQTIPASSDYTYYTAGSVQIPVSTDGLSGSSGYVDIYISFPAGASLAVTSIQVVPAVNVQAAPLLPYDLASSNRAEALMGDYYIPRLTQSTLPSLLTAWDFPLNPAQEGDAQTANTTADYMWDQMIALTSSGNVGISRNTATGGLTLTPASNNQAMYILQYLSLSQAKEMLYTRLSSNISAWLGSGVGQVVISVSLYRAPSTTAIPILPSTLVAISSTGALSGLTSGWTQIPRSNLDTPRAALSTTAPTVDQDIQFTGWEITDSGQIANTDKFAIVVSFAWTTATVINVNSISLCKGDLPTRPAPKTRSDVLSECQFYFEKSYDGSVVAGTASSPAGNLIAMQGANPDTDGSHDEIATRSFGITYKTKKRTAPTVILYSPVSGSSAFVSFIFSWRGSIQAGYPKEVPLTTGSGMTLQGWAQANNGQFGTNYISNSYIVLAHPGSVQDGTDESYILFHYTADCRLGMIA